MYDITALPPLSNTIRALAMDAVEAAQSGHPGMPMGMADVATVLFARHLNFWPHQPKWANRDRFILSGGHGSMLLYALGYLTGYEKMTLAEIKRFRQLGSHTPGHPERDLDCGVEMTTGPLGQGIASSVGFAIAAKLSNTTYGDTITNHKTYVMCGDGDLQEGISHEACALAGHMNLSNLIVLYDDNGISIDGPTNLSFTEDTCARFTAYGWVTKKINGHDMADIDAALTWAKQQTKPVLIACKTTIGFGAGKKAGTADCHGSPLGADDIAIARQTLNWPHAPFVVPNDILKSWRDIGARGRDAYVQWEEALSALPADTRQKFIEQQAGLNQTALTTAINTITEKFLAEPPTIATRKSSQLVLDTLVPALPNLIGGSADLTGSNLTKVKNFDHQYIHYGVREHGMGAIMNGISLYGGYVPYGGTFLSFADYCRPAIRLAALMQSQAIYVMTHDSIGLGEDGPTHQPIEHLASLRAMPNVLVLRPADAVETAQVWDIALRHTTGPSILCLTRQNVKPLNHDRSSGSSRGPMDPRNKSEGLDVYRGAYAVNDIPNPRVVICATGSEVEIATDVAETLNAQNIAARVVSIPSFEIFHAQSPAYKSEILGGANVLRIGIEAGVRQGWDDIIGPDGLFFGLSTFGASAPYKDLYAHFSLTADAITPQIIEALKG